MTHRIISLPRPVPKLGPFEIDVVRKEEDRNSLRQNREGDAREIDLEASLMS